MAAPWQSAGGNSGNAMTIKEKVYMGLAATTFLGFMGPIATTVVMREARIEQAEKDIQDLKEFQKQVIEKYIEYLEK